MCIHANPDGWTSDFKARYRWVRGARVLSSATENTSVLSSTTENTRTKKVCGLNQCSGSSTWDCSGTEDTATRTTSCEGNRRSLLFQKKKCTSQLLVGKDLHSLQSPTAGSSCVSPLVLLSPLAGAACVEATRAVMALTLRVITKCGEASGAQQEVTVSLRCPGWVHGQTKVRCSRFWVECRRSDHTGGWHAGAVGPRLKQEWYNWRSEERKKRT